jgi:hypothetical protein
MIPDRPWRIPRSGSACHVSIMAQQGFQRVSNRKKRIKMWFPGCSNQGNPEVRCYPRTGIICAGNQVASSGKAIRMKTITIMMMCMGTDHHPILKISWPVID